MKFWGRSTRREGARDRIDLEVDACLDLLASSRSGGGPRGRDQTDAILARVSQHLPLVDTRGRRVLTLRRAVAGAALAASIALGAVTLHAWQDVASMDNVLGQSAPASRVLASTWDDMNSAVARVAGASRQASLLRPASLLLDHPGFAILADAAAAAQIHGAAGEPGTPRRPLSASRA